MNIQEIAYFLFGISLVALFGVIIKYYYSRKRQSKVEDAKFKMLDDED